MTNQNAELMPTPRTDRDDRPYPSPEYAQLIQFEGSTCVVMAPEDYEALYEHARQLERELIAATTPPQGDEVERVLVWNKEPSFRARVRELYPSIPGDILDDILAQHCEFIKAAISAIRQPTKGD